MLEKFKKIPKPVVLGQGIFIVAIIYFVLSVSSGESRSVIESLYGIGIGCIIGILTSLIPKEKEWKYIVFDIVAAALIFIGYVQVFSFR